MFVRKPEPEPERKFSKGKPTRVEQQTRGAASSMIMITQISFDILYTAGSLSTAYCSSPAKPCVQTEKMENQKAKYTSKEGRPFYFYSSTSTSSWCTVIVNVCTLHRPLVSVQRLLPIEICKAYFSLDQSHDLCRLI